MIESAIDRSKQFAAHYKKLAVGDTGTVLLSSFAVTHGGIL